MTDRKAEPEAAEPVAAGPEVGPAAGEGGAAPAVTPGRLSGEGLVRASLGGTAVLVVTSALAVAFDGPVRSLNAIVAGVLFVLGCAAYLLGYARAVQRSRTEVVTMAGLAFLVDAAPKAVQRRLIGSTVVEVVVVVTAAAVRPFTPLAFGILAPVFGLGVQCLWAATHGRFPRRSAPTPPGRARPAPGRAGGGSGGRASSGPGSGGQGSVAPGSP